jgi:hypothetical protein
MDMESRRHNSDHITDWVTYCTQNMLNKWLARSATDDSLAIQVRTVVLPIRVGVSSSSSTECTFNGRSVRVGATCSAFNEHGVDVDVSLSAQLPGTEVCMLDVRLSDEFLGDLVFNDRAEHAQAGFRVSEQAAHGHLDAEFTEGGAAPVLYVRFAVARRLADGTTTVGERMLATAQEDGDVELVLRNGGGRARIHMAVLRAWLEPDSPLLTCVEVASSQGAGTKDAVEITVEDLDVETLRAMRDYMYNPSVAAIFAALDEQQLTSLLMYADKMAFDELSNEMTEHLLAYMDLERYAGVVHSCWRIISQAPGFNPQRFKLRMAAVISDELTRVSTDASDVVEVACLASKRLRRE